MLICGEEGKFNFEHVECDMAESTVKQTSGRKLDLVGESSGKCWRCTCVIIYSGMTFTNIASV